MMKYSTKIANVNALPKPDNNALVKDGLGLKKDVSVIVKGSKSNVNQNLNSSTLKPANVNVLNNSLALLNRYGIVKFVLVNANS